jgi:F-type H+-transporting ATPase subunit gamma
MASMRSIKRRIQSVGSTQQITRAMNLVAASKLQRSKSKLENARPFYEETKKMMYGIISASQGIKNEFLSARPVRNSALLVISSDRGLCGGYNVNVSKKAIEVLTDKKSEHVVTIGTKARDYFKRRKRRVIRTYQGISEIPHYEDAQEIGVYLMELYNAQEVDEIYLVYTRFVSMLNHEPTVIKLLPLDASVLPSGYDDSNERSAVMEFEPNEETFLQYVIPRYINTFIYGALAESSACEQSARMTSMDSATKNSSALIDEYTLRYNRARQGAITQELTEIVSGANALGG